MLPNHFLTIYFNIIFPSIHRSSKCFLFGQVSPTRTLSAPLPSPHVLHARPISFFLIRSPNIIDEEYKSLNSSLCSLFLSLVSHLVPLRSKYFPQHHILEHSETTFLSQCERSSFTHIKSIGKITPIVLHALVFICYDSKPEHKRVCIE